MDAEAKALVGKIIQITEAFRSFRAEFSIPWSTHLTARLAVNDPGFGYHGDRIGHMVTRLTRISLSDVAVRHEAETAKFVDSESVKKAIQVVAGDHTFLIFVDGVVDFEAEKARLTKALEASTKEAKSLEGRLSNAAFVEKAKPEAVEKARADHAMHKAEAERLAAALARLG